MSADSARPSEGQWRRSSECSARSSGIQLPARPNGVTASAAGGSTPSMTPAVPSGSERTTVPRASMIALIPVGVERSTGMPSSAARRRAWARCCGGPQRAEPGVVRRVEDEIGAVAVVDDMAREDDFVAQLEADPAPAAARSIVRGPGPGREVDVARRQARQADRRQQRAASADIRHRGPDAPCRSGRRPRRRGRGRRRCWSRRSGGRRRRSGRARRSADIRRARASDAARVRSNAASAWCSPLRGVLERLGDRRFGPQQQAPPGIGVARRRQGGQPPRGFVGEARPPLVLLADVGLDDAHRLDRDRRLGDPRYGQRPQDAGSTPAISTPARYLRCASSHTAPPIRTTRIDRP